MLCLSKLLLVFHIIGFVSTHEDHGGNEEVLESLIKTLNVTTKNSENHTVFTSSDIENLLKMLHFKDCTKDELPSFCNLCFTSKDMHDWYNISINSTIDEEKFLSISEGILYLLLNPQERRKNCIDLKNIKLSTPTNMIYKITIGNYLGTKSKVMTEEGIQLMLKDYKKVFASILSEKKCFNVHDVISGSNVSETSISKHEFEIVNGYILNKLLNKNCIEIHDHGHHGNLPKQSDFINEIFTHYALNNTHMNNATFEKLVKALDIGTVKKVATTDHDHDHKHDHDHDHRKKRSIFSSSKRARRDVKGVTEKCFNGDSLLDIFHVHGGDLIDKKKFQEICPALIQQIESRSCKKDDLTGIEKILNDGKNYEKWEPWIASTLSLIVISIGSMIGIVAAPFTRRSWFPFLIMFLIALAVATLVGDAILHLFPHSLDLHSHEEEIIEIEHDHGNEFFKPDSFLWKAVLFLVGIFLFLGFEVTMKAFGSGHGHSHGPERGDESPQINPELYLGRRKSLKQEEAKGTLQMNEDVIVNMNKRESIAVPTPSGMLTYIDKKPSLDSESEIHFNNGNQTISISPSKEDLVSNDLSIKNFRSIVWMVLIGDAIHNFMDGVAVGVAFSEQWPSGLHGGISTSIAIFCHELPHELGDFAVLLASGLSIKQAILLNFISSLTAILGGFLGVSLGTKWDASPWIFAVTAGLFVYIALADMLPEALNSTSLKQRPWLSVAMIEGGLLVGYIIMFCLAAWEEDIKKLIQ